MFTANPHAVSGARLLRSLDYDEAQEIASSGARVLHPRCILPLKQYAIPLTVHATQIPELEGTAITATGGDGGPRVKAVCVKKGVTLVAMETLGMWHQVGFLADAFAVFKDHGLSIDLVSTSETSVTATLDPAVNALTPRAVQRLVADLARICRVEIIGPCAAVSLVGRKIRAIMHRLGRALELFEEESSPGDAGGQRPQSDFRGRRGPGRSAGRRLHDLTVSQCPRTACLGRPGNRSTARGSRRAGKGPVVESRRDDLIEIAVARERLRLRASDVARSAAESGSSGASIGCCTPSRQIRTPSSSLGSRSRDGLRVRVARRDRVVLTAVPGIDRERILYTPNFAPRDEYAWALGTGAWVTLDNLHPLRHWGELFRGRELLVRIDTGYGRGHHDHVRTAGVHSKFGVPLFELDELERRTAALGARIVGLHAHTGSGVFDVRNWQDVGQLLGGLTTRFSDARIVNLGGGLGVPEKPGQAPVDLAALQAVIDGLRDRWPRSSCGSSPVDIWWRRPACS